MFKIPTHLFASWIFIKSESILLLEIQIKNDEACFFNFFTLSEETLYINLNFLFKSTKENGSLTNWRQYSQQTLIAFLSKKLLFYRKKKTSLIWLTKNSTINNAQDTNQKICVIFIKNKLAGISMKCVSASHFINFFFSPKFDDFKFQF